MKIEVIRSKRRKKTISARMDEDTMYVSVPANMSEKELNKIIKNFQKRFERQKLKKQINKEKAIEDDFNRLNKKYFNGKLKIKSIEYVTNQQRKFGCCNYKTRIIRISHRLADMPSWVKDYVIVHEMAHLLVPNHSKAFWDIVYLYKLTERARGYLIAKGMESDERTDTE